MSNAKAVCNFSSFVLVVYYMGIFNWMLVGLRFRKSDTHWLMD
jgi:hypothetical protein